jgi:hypothetical protein
MRVNFAAVTEQAVVQGVRDERDDGLRVVEQ